MPDSSAHATIVLLLAWNRTRRRGTPIEQGVRRDAGQGDEADGLLITNRNRAGIVEQNTPSVTSRFDCFSRHRDDVETCGTIDAGDADRWQQCRGRTGLWNHCGLPGS